jgi:hypothetical protein
MDLQTLQRLLLLSTAIGYAALTVKLWASDTFWQAPAFAVYIAFVACYTLFYDPYNVRLLLIVQPITMALKLAVAIEAFAMAVARIGPREKVWLRITSGLIAGSGVLLSFGHYHGTAPVSWFEELRGYFHVGLALACSAGCGMLWIHPPKIWKPVREHGLIVTAYFVNIAAGGFATVKTLDDWLLWNCSYLIGALVCITLWLRGGLFVAKLRNPPFEVRYAVRETGVLSPPLF